MSFKFLLIFRKAAAGELAEDSGLYEIYRQMEEIDVDKEGVKGAKNFFQAKVHVYVHYIPSSYPQPPNFCTEAVIARVMITCMLAHWMKPRHNQSAILLPAFGRTIQVLHNAYS